MPPERQIKSIASFLDRFPEVERVIIDGVERSIQKPQDDEQKEENRAFSAERVVIEHAFGGTKRYRAMADIYRNRKKDFDDRLMLSSAGLWNFYLKAA